MFPRARTALVAVLILLMGSSPPSLAQDEAAVVEGLISARGEAPLPMVGRGAANFSPEQTASFLCVAEGLPLNFLTSLPAQAAHEATLKAREVRMRAFRGEATAREMEQAELDRQRAVGRLAGQGRVTGPAGPTRSGLVIEGVQRRRVVENGRPVLLVTGKVRNTSANQVELPPLTVQALDVRSFILASQTSQLEEVFIGPGETQAFTFRFKNPPQYTAEVRPHFAPPFGVRNFRGCDFFDPLSFDPNQERVRRERAAVTPVPVPVVGDGAPAYTAKELAAMVQRARQDAQSSFSQRPSACAPPAPWRPLMVMADRMEEAWIATNAAEEVRRDAARGVFLASEVVEAELSRQLAVRAFMTARPPQRRPDPVDRPGLVVQGVQRSGTNDLVLRGEVLNSGRQRAPMPPLLVTVVDRYGFILTESLQRPDGQIRPGRTQEFRITFDFPPTLVGEARVEIAC